MSKKIFLSHAVNDKVIVDQFIDLLSTGANITREDIFCSSQIGNIPSGADFVEYIKEELKDAKVVIPFFSRNYVDSQFCLCELGAAWVLTAHVLPIIIPPFVFKDLNTLYKNIQCTNIDDKYELTTFINKLMEIVNPEGKISGIWEKKKDEYQKKFSRIMRTLPVPKYYSKEEYDKIDKEKSEIENELLEKSELLTQKEKIIEDLKKAKDKEDVETVLQKYEGDDLFDQKVDLVKDVLNKLSDVVIFALYQDLKGESIVIKNTFEQKDLLVDCERAVKDDFLKESDGEYELNVEDPKIDNAVKILYELREVIETIDGDRLEELKEEYQMNISLSNIRLWEKLFEVTIRKYS